MLQYAAWLSHQLRRSRLRLICDGTRAETRFRLSAKRTSPFKSAGASVQSATGSQVVRISSSNAGYTMFRGRVKGTGYPLHSLVSPSLPMHHHVPSHFNWTLPFQKEQWLNIYIKKERLWSKKVTFNTNIHKLSKKIFAYYVQGNNMSDHTPFLAK
jgi:hypothetical protein